MPAIVDGAGRYDVGWTEVTRWAEARCGGPVRLVTAARPGLLPDASRTLAGRPDSGPYRQVDQPHATLGGAKLKIN